MTDITTPGERPSSRRRFAIVAAVLVVAAAAAVLAATLLLDKASEHDEEARKCCWATGITPGWMSEAIGLEIPENATNRRAAYHTSVQYDTGLLTFTLPSESAEEYLVALNSDGAVAIDNIHPQGKDFAPPNGFAHLGLPEPETIGKGMRLSSLCPGEVETPEGKNAHYCVDIFAHEYKQGSTRIYLKANIESSVSPRPTFSTPPPGD